MQVGCVDFLAGRPPSTATKKMMKKCERRARTRNRYGTVRAQKAGWNNAWRVLRQLWYAKFCFGSSPVSPIPHKRTFSDNSECIYIKESRLRHEKENEKEGGGREGGKRGPVLDETQFPDEVFTPLFLSVLHFVTAHTARDLTISYSSMPLEKPMKFASRRDSRPTHRRRFMSHRRLISPRVT